MMRKEFSLKGLPEDFKSKEAEDFYSPFTTKSPIKNSTNRPMASSVALFDG